ncbi:MAG TPA: hypothetical protein VGM82_09405 [Gemmatimonadaceae bacterium]|jgi:hypothetical protein
MPSARFELAATAVETKANVIEPEVERRRVLGAGFGSMECRFEHEGVRMQSMTTITE